MTVASVKDRIGKGESVVKKTGKSASDRATNGESASGGSDAVAVECIAEGLVTAKVAARLLGVRSTSNFRYHARLGRIQPAHEVTIGSIRTPYYDPADVLKLKSQIEENRENGSGGRPRFSQ